MHVETPKINFRDISEKIIETVIQIYIYIYIGAVLMSCDLRWRFIIVLRDSEKNVIIFFLPTDYVDNS